jgi:hypothetical protein
MSDFLRNLVLRSLGSADIVQPRLPSLFEPLPRAMGSLSAPGVIFLENGREALSEDTEERETEALPASPRPRPLRTPESISPPTGGTVDGGQEHALFSRLGPVAPPPAASLAMQVARPPKVSPLPDAGSSASHFPERDEDRAGRHSAGTQPSAKNGFGASPYPPGAEAQSVRTAEPAVHPTKVKTFVPIVPAPSMNQKGDREIQDFTPTEPPLSLRRLLESHPPSSLPAVLPRTAGSSEPTIQVTIGRIEVRATQPAAPAPKRRASSPVATLEEYLESRSRRGGR